MCETASSRGVLGIQHALNLIGFWFCRIAVNPIVSSCLAIRSLASIAIPGNVLTDYQGLYRALTTTSGIISLLHTWWVATDSTPTMFKTSLQPPPPPLPLAEHVVNSSTIT